MKKIIIVLVAVIFLLNLDSCTSEDMEHNSKTLSFQFNAAGNYTGFDTIPENYTIEQALKDGCYIRENSSEVKGLDSWRIFIENSNNGQDSSIRIMSIYDDVIYYQDLFYIDGNYRVFDSSSEDLSDHKYKYMLELRGRTPNAERDSYFAILTDDETITFDNLSKTLYSSSTEVINSISPYKFVFMGVE